MSFNDEAEVFDQILSYTTKQIQDKFTYEDKEFLYSFLDKNDNKNYVNVNKKKIGEPFIARVNADFNFCKPAGSNNYPQLIEVGEHLMTAFNLEYEE